MDNLYCLFLQETSEAFKLGTTSGSAVINDAIVHLSVDTLPFGGVGQRNMLLHLSLLLC